AGEVRADLVTHIDVGATSLALAGIEIPDYIQGRPLFGAHHRPRDIVFTARDRCDETVDTIRAARTERFKYIRNFRYHRSHMQPSRYKDGKEIVQIMRSLHAAGKLSELEGRVFAAQRPVEELYDLKTDPNETVNLAANADHAATVAKLRTALYDWMEESRDMGMVPEPILEDLGKKYGSKYDAMRHPDQKGLVAELIRTADAGAWKRSAELEKALSSKRPAVRYWAAIGLGNTGRPTDAKLLLKHLDDPNPTVRVAAALGCSRRQPHQRAIEVLAAEIGNPNRLVGLYAIRAIEELGDNAKATSPAVARATASDYDPTNRVARRLAAQWGLL
ncbi:MAG: hypothetical protein GY953_24605, partial [bacterium]|nr:hypothetical protein [bacterium]